MPDHLDLSSLDAAEKDLVLEAKSNPEVFRALATAKLIAQEKHCRATHAGVDDRFDKLEANDTTLFKSVGKLKTWQARILGGLAAIGGVIAVIAFILLLIEKFGKGR